MTDDVTCDEVLQRLEVYLDGEIGAGDARDVEEHLAGCGDCLQRQSFLRRLREIVREKCGTVERLPEGLADRIRRAVRSAGPGD